MVMKRWNPNTRKKKRSGWNHGKIDKIQRRKGELDENSLNSVTWKAVPVVLESVDVKDGLIRGAAAPVGPVSHFGETENFSAATATLVHYRMKNH